MVLCIPSTHQTLTKDQLGTDDEELTRLFPILDKALLPCCFGSSLD